MDNPHDAEHGGLDTRGFVQRLLYYASALCLIGVVGVVFYATMARYFFHAPPFWGEEVPVLLFVWMGFLAAGLAIVSGWNVRVEALDLLLPKRVINWFRLVTHSSSSRSWRCSCTTRRTCWSCPSSAACRPPAGRAG